MNLGRSILLAFLGLFVGVSPAWAEEKPNVVFLIIDDLNDWIGCLDGHPDTITPNIDRLAARGTLFTNAHCAAPLCNPSRTAVFTGLNPTSSGIYNNRQWWRPALADVETIPEVLRSHGYRAVGAGKVFHHETGSHPPDLWAVFFDQVFDHPWHVQAPGELKYPAIAWPDGFPLNGIENVRLGKRPPQNPYQDDWGPFDTEDLEMGDGQMVQWVMDEIARPQEKPIFLAAGIYRPHLPWYAPREYFDLFDEDTIALPPRKEGDLDDIPDAGRRFVGSKSYHYFLKIGKYREAVRAYLASVAYADALVGRLVDAIDKSSVAENTILILWSDHGWHLGEKEHWQKATLWERATRVPLIVSAPGYAAGQRCSRPVSLTDLYPTILDLCGLKRTEPLDGRSLVPLLADPDMAWPHPAVTTMNRGNHSVRDDQYRLIHYQDGSEELYDYETDPNEWNNLADNPAYEEVRNRLREGLPNSEVPEAPDHDAWRFYFEEYRWERR